MKVIGAGFGRTGTKSLKNALEELGLGPCHHMEEVIKNPSQADVWMKATRGEAVDWRALLGGYQAAVDWPAAAFYKELMVEYPDAKVLLSVRDPEAWYESCINTIHEIGRGFPMRLTGRFVPVMGRIHRMANALVWEKTFQGRFLDKEFALGIFREHIEEVKRHVPHERLLVYQVKEGWEPLCRFLEVPVPDKPFPRLNDTQEFRGHIRRARVLSSLLLTIPSLAGLWLLYRLFARLSRP